MRKIKNRVKTKLKTVSEYISSRKYRKICYFSSLTAVITVLMTLSISSGWFDSNKYTDSQGMHVTINHKEIESQLTVYNLADKDNDNVADSVIVSPENELKLFVYDTVFRSNNISTGAALRIHLTGNGVKKSGTLDISVKRDTSVSSSSEKNSHYFSSLASFKCFTGAESGSNDQQTYNNIKSKSDTISECRTFFNGNSKQEDITFKISYSNASEHELDIFMFIDYDDALISDFSENIDLFSESSNFINGQNIMDIQNDISSVYITYA